MQGFRPEIGLLLSCARTCPDPVVSDRTRELLGYEIDWAYLLGRAELHGLIPLLYWNLRTISSGLVPFSIMDRIKVQFLANAGRNLLLTRKLLEILNLLEANGILAIPFKGPALASSLYGNLALRTFSDLDILVRKKDIPQAKDLLLSRGYRLNFSLTPKQEITFLRAHSEYAFIHENSRILVELQWEILPSREFPLAFDLEPPWKRLESTSLEGRSVPALSSEDLLLALCLHGAKHCWERLIWICDLAELIRVHKGMDWELVIEQASRQNLRLILFLGLFLAQDILGVDLPQEIAQEVSATPRTQSLANFISQRIFQDSRKPPHLLDDSLFYLKLCNRIRDKARYCFHLALTPTVGDWEIISLPHFLSLFYYLIHPIRMVGKYWFRPFRSFGIDI